LEGQRYKTQSPLVSVLLHESPLAVDKRSIAPIRSAATIDRPLISNGSIGRGDTESKVGFRGPAAMSSALWNGNAIGLGGPEQALSPEQLSHERETGEQIKNRQPVLHLDGAALGRWAIQHLERALSKPANGITGIDPRATSPRGHVSPF
jgi:hypothetical protein